jgi:hypothetical protein
VVPFFISLLPLLRRRRQYDAPPPHEPTPAEIAWREELAAMNRPPRNAWGGAKTAEEWFDLQARFAEAQRLYDQRDHSSASSNTSVGPWPWERDFR